MRIMIRLHGHEKSSEDRSSAEDVSRGEFEVPAAGVFVVYF
jgi:hypothetical protein